MGTNRVETLDYLRGILAFSVMIYHYTLWAEVDLIYPFDNILNRLGVYAVAAFYVLSGASLAIVYANREINTTFIWEFTVKRFLRIAPLFYVATTITIGFMVLRRILTPDEVAESHGILTYITNYLLIFGWVEPDKYFATGAWSIGNEIVFYCLFPLLLFLRFKSQLYFTISVLLTFGIGLYFSFFAFDKSGITEQWALYVSPFNQLFLFVGGMMIGFLVKKGYTVSRGKLLSLTLAAVALFIFYPVSDKDQIHVVTGVNRIVFSLLILSLCFAAALWKTQRVTVVNKVLKYLGDVSYSVYLIHPIVATVAFRIFDRLQMGTILSIIAAMIITLIASSFTYRFIELPFMKKSKSILQKQRKTKADISVTA